jgi:hypothetical protein
MTGTSISKIAMTFPLWLVLSVLALLALTIVLAAFRTSRREALAAACIVVVLGAAIAAWTEYQTTSRRQAIEERLMALQARAQAPSSALACVEDNAGEIVNAGCEQTIFATPQTVAAATSFTAERFALLADTARYAGRRGAHFDALVAGLRGGLERDRFGLLANYLKVRERCTVDKCDWLAVLQNPTAIQHNLKNQTFDAILARHASAWTRERPAEQVASAPTTEEPAPASNTGKGTPLPQDYVLPSADSIPPISIMTNEPTAAAAPPAATPPARPQAHEAPAASAPAKPLRPAKRSSPPAATTMSNAPLALTPPGVKE